MSDMDDDDFMVEDNDEDFDFQYEDDDEGEETHVGLENKYYNAKNLKDDDPQAALKAFQSVVDQEEEKGDWGFKALKQMTKITFGLKKYQECLEHYKKLLTYTKNSVVKSYAEKSLSNILDLVSSSTDMEFLEEFYGLTLKTLEDQKNDRLWTKTNLKLAKVWLDRGEFARLTKILRALQLSVERDPDPQRKGTLLLDLYALEIQMYTLTKNNKKLKDLYQQSLAVRSAIPHPRILGVIRECGGKMHMSEKEWDKAQVDFFQAFKSYDEAGSGQRIQCLKYLVLANMLTESEIDPFESQETKPYRNDPQIQAMTNLVNAYQRKDIDEFEKILKNSRSTIMDDPFIRQYIDEVTRSIRMQFLVQMMKPYTRIKIDFAAKRLGITNDEAMDLFINLILDEKVKGKIDQLNGRFEVNHEKEADVLENQALKQWSDKISSLQQAIVSKLA